MSSNHEVSHERRQLVAAAAAPQTVPPEVPRRPRSTLQGSRSAHVGRGGNSNNRQHPPQPAVREIHKNAWLKRNVPGDKKKGAPFVKKYDKLWVVFCVHDDVEAFLEFYSEPKLAISHRPNAYVSLNSCLHVSPSIVGQENDEYQFAVTLSTHVIRLVAANWDQMIEWVESLQGKLREMNILSPKDNLYSKLPETKGVGLSSLPGYISTRDPNSPLPPTPRLNASSSSSAPAPESSSSSAHEPDTHSHNSVSTNTRPITNANTSAAPISLLNENYGLGTTMYVQPSSRDGSDSGLGSGGSIMSSISEPRVTVFPISINGASVSICPSTVTADLYENGVDSEPTPRPRTRTPSPSVSVVTGNNNSTRLQVGSDENESFLDNLSHIMPSASSAANHSNSTTVHSTPDVAQLYSQPQPRNKNKTKTTPATAASGKETQPQTTRLRPQVRNHNDVIVRQLSDPPRPSSTPTENIYEYLFTPETENSSVDPGHPRHPRHLNADNISSSASAVASSTRLSRCDAAPPLAPRRQVRRLCSTSQRSSSLNRLQEQNGANGARRGQSQNRSQLDPSRNSGAGSGQSQHQIAKPKDGGRGAGAGQPTVHLHVNGSESDGGTSPFIHIHGLQGEPMEALIGVKSGEYRIRREEGIPGSHTHESELLPNNSDGSRNQISQGGNLLSHVPLKEQQVMRLQAEMNHPGGVRVVLRKKDCVNCIGFVDYLGAVWIAGWKQQQHPVLYYAFHVGDQVLKVAGVAVQNSVEAARAIKMAANLQVEFVIKRVPHGNVFVLKRSREGEPLGLVVINNTPEIGEVLPDGLSAGQGLPLSCRGADGVSNCTWFLTEVNNRPLSLLARENEVRERLNAVGKEISILVQPSDLVKHLKKQLKTMKGFKDYLVV